MFSSLLSVAIFQAAETSLAMCWHQDELFADWTACKFITFCVSRRRRKMYCGHARLCVCVSVCLSVCPRPYAHTIARTGM